MQFDEDEDNTNNTYEYNPKPSKARNNIQQNYHPMMESPPPQFSTIKSSPSTKKSSTKKSSKPQPDDFEEMLNNLAAPIEKMPHNVLSSQPNLTPAKSPKRPIKRKKGDNSQSSRPKMIHTQKTRVNIDDGKRKTKTFITRTTAEPLDSKSNNERNRPRTKNVNYHYMLPDKLPNATFPSEIALNEILNIKNEKLLEQEKGASDSEDASGGVYSFDLSKRNYNKYNSDIVNDLEEILRSPIKGSINQSSTTLNHNESVLETQDDCGRNESYEDEYHNEEVDEEHNEPDPIRYNPRPKRNIKPKSSLKVSPSSIKQEDKVSTRKSYNKVTKYGDRVIKTEQEISINEDYDDDDDNENDNSTINNSDSKSSNVPDSINCNATDSAHYKCEMCSAVFTDRAQLLVHVPVHI